MKNGDRVYLLECWGENAPEPYDCPDGYSIGVIQKVKDGVWFDVLLVESTHYFDLGEEGAMYWNAHISRLKLVTKNS